MTELIRLTARDAVAKLRTGELCPRDLLDAAEARIAAVEPRINALPTRCFDRARDRADRLMAAGPPTEPGPGYLFGLPLAIKDLTDVAGVRTTYGSPILADNVPAASDILVERLEANGGLVCAKSNTPEFGAGAQTFNPVFGVTATPWDVSRTSAGSSGGSAAALAAGEVWLATGSDLAGSLRTPASFCGVVGFRPSPGRVARAPTPLPFDTLAVEGPMARTVGDVALMLDALAGAHPRDPIALPAPAEPFQKAVDEPGKLGRVAFSPDLGITPVATEVREICAAAAARFGDLGAEVEAACIDFRDAERCFQALRGARFLASLGPRLESHPGQLKEDIIWNIERGRNQSADEVAWAERKRGEIAARAADFFARYDVLVCPAAAVAPFDHAIRYIEEIEGTRFDSYIGWLALAFAITLTGCPSLSLPCGVTENGLPVGLQIVGPPRGEARVLSAAAQFEAVAGCAGRVPLEPRP